MSHLTLEKSDSEARKAVEIAVREVFRDVASADKRLVLQRVEIPKKLDPQDYESQRESKIKGSAWGPSVYGHFSLVDDSGKTLDQGRVKLFTLPQKTSRHTYLYGGQEYQFDTQFRLKPGIYTRITDRGEFASRISAEGKFYRSTEVFFDPDSGKYTLKVGTSNVPISVLLHLMGVSKGELDAAIGTSLASTNYVQPKPHEYAKLYRAFFKEDPHSEEDMHRVSQTLNESRMDPDATEYTTGKRLSTVDKNAILVTLQRLLSLVRGESDEDDPNSLVTKSVMYYEDFLKEWLIKYAPEIKRKIGQKLPAAKKVSEAINSSALSPAVARMIMSPLAQRREQHNVLDILSGWGRTTLRGPGGISDSNMIRDEMRTVHPSHMAFLDPVKTPECFDDKTEVFTESGWVPWTAINPGIKLACLIKGRMEFHFPEKLISRRYSGLMYGVKNGKIDYLVTPNHRIFNRPIDNRKDGTKPAWRFNSAESVFGKSRFVPTSCKPYEGVDIVYFCLPEVKNPGNALKFYGVVPIDDWAEFLGWYISEGSVTKTNVRISQSKTASLEKYEKIHNLLKSMPLGPWSASADGKGFAKVSRQLAEYLKQFGKCHEKHLPEEVFYWPEKSREILLDTLLEGDGRIESNRLDGRTYKQKVYTTTSPRLAKDVNRLMTSLGFAATVKEYVDDREERYLNVFEIRAIVRQPYHAFRQVNKDHYRSWYEGIVYCATVPGGMLLVRRGEGVGIWTGNSDTIGTTLHLASTARKEGNGIVSTFINLKTGKELELSPKQAYDSVIAFPDEYDLTVSPPKARKSKVSAAYRGNITDFPSGKAQYVPSSSHSLFHVTTNLIPFLRSNNGVRAMTASRQVEQAIPLVHREAPLVQVKYGRSKESSESVIGKHIGSSVCPVDGEVTAIKKGKIMVKDAKGEPHTIHIYRHFPLNNSKGYLHSIPSVSVGDKVRKGQIIADSNYTKDGKLALGTNLSVAYIPWRGLTYEDAVVISETAAKKLTSDHLHQFAVEVGPRSIVGKKKFVSYYPNEINAAQAQKLDLDGVIQEGQTVEKGDFIFAGMSEKDIDPDSESVMRVSKRAVSAYADSSVRWEKKYPGVVTGVEKVGKKFVIHVKTQEPAVEGDKVCYDEETEMLTSIGWKNVADVTIDDEVCTLQEGDQIAYCHPDAVHHYASGGRMYHIESIGVDLFVTSDHSMYVRKRFSGYYDDRSSYGLYPAKDIAGKKVRYKKDGLWTGQDPEYVVLPPLEVAAGRGGKGTRTLPELKIPVHDYMFLLGAYLSEGNIYDQRGSYGVEISQIKDLNRAQLIERLRSTGLKFNDRVSKGTKVRIYSKQLMLHFRKFGKSRDKYIPSHVYSYSKGSLQELFNWLMWGDGTSKNGRPVTYTTVSKRLADDVQRLCLHIGYAATVKPKRNRGVQTIKGKEYYCQGIYDVGIITKKLRPEINHSHVKSQSAQKEYFVEDYQGPVHCVTVPGHVVYVRRNGKAVWCGNCGRHGNKAIVSSVIPDDEMLRNSEGKPFDILMNPAGIVGRINLGQIYETVASKVAVKTGKPLIFDNFESSQDTHKAIEDLLKKHGISDSEIVVDPVDGPTDKPVITGFQHVFKLTHQVDKKLSSRGAVSKSTGERLSYTSDMSPSRGGKAGGQSIGTLDTYALLAHGANANLKEMFTYKGDAQNNLFWTRLKTGGVLPEPEIPYTAKKFLAYMEAMGVHVKKDGNKMQIMPMTDKDITRISDSSLPNPGEALDYKMRPVKGGIFDSLKTGGLRGTKWTHVDLPEPVVNPVAKDGAVRLLAYAHPEHGGKLLEKIISGKVGLSTKGEIVPVDQATVVGGEAVKKLLKKINVDKTLKQVQIDLEGAPPSKVSVLNKTRKYLIALKELGYKPAEAYILTKFPVLPPAYRPITIDQKGVVSMDDVNGIYKKLGETITAVKKTPKAMLPPKHRAERAAAIQDMVDAVSVSGYSANNRPMKSIMQLVTGTSPKYGFYQRKVLNRRQDLSARSTIVPNPELGIDEVEIPEKSLWELYSPFVAKNLTMAGYNSVDALTHVKDKTDTAKAALDEELKDRPVLLKRDPVLHKFGIQAFYAKRSPGETIRITPTVTAGYNADFDGDQMAVFVPVTEEAKQEAKGLVPSQNLFGTKSGALMHKPAHESQLGIFMLTEMGKKKNVAFTSFEKLLVAYKSRRIKLQDVIKFKGRETTLGRLLLANTIPKGRVQDEWYQRIAYDRRFRMGKEEVDEMMSTMGRVQPADFPKALMELRQLGDRAAYKLGGSFNMKDLKPLKTLSRKLPATADTERSLNAYANVQAKVEALAKDHMVKTDNNLHRIVRSGARGKWDQLKQIVLAPGLMVNAKGQTVKKPVNRSYSEGLTLSEYWTTLHGARKGMISKVKGTALPGYLSKQIISSVADVRVTSEDCQTNNGILELISDRDIIGRYLAKAQKIGKASISKNALVDSQLLLRAKSAGVRKLLVRTPLKCEVHDGVCAKCYGKWHDGHTPPVGTNIGIISAQSLGEPSTQLSMKLFHEGGVVSKATKQVDLFAKAKLLFEAPQKLKNESVLSQAAGIVSAVKKDATGWRVKVGPAEHFIPATKKLKIKRGDRVLKGQALSSGDVNVHGLVELAGVGAAQNHLVGALHEIYSPEGVDKRHIETIVRHMTDMGVVDSSTPGTGFGRGDIISMAKITAMNKRYVPVEWAIGKKLAEKYYTYGKGTEVTEDVVKDLRNHGILRVRIDDTGVVKANSIVRGVNMLPLTRTEDWAAKMSFERLRGTLETGALTGATADVSGKWPLPSVGFGNVPASRP